MLLVPSVCTSIITSRKHLSRQQAHITRRNKIPTHQHFPRSSAQQSNDTININARPQAQQTPRADRAATTSTVRMANHLQTPETFMPPKSETPASADELAEMNTYGARKVRLAAFKKLQTNERTAVKIYLDRFIVKDRKAQITAGQDRFSMLLKKRLEKIDQRVDQGKGSLATSFPDLYDERVEDRWVRDKLGVYLTGDAHDQEDQDDAEDLPKKPRIRSEIAEHLWEDNEDSIAVKHGRRCKSSVYYEESDDDEDEADEDDHHEPDKPVVGIACQRGYSIRFGYEGLEELKAKLKAKAEASAEKAKIVVGVAVTPGFARPEAPSRKRKAEDDGEDGQSDAKRVKV